MTASLSRIVAGRAPLEQPSVHRVELPRVIPDLGKEGVHKLADFSGRSAGPDRGLDIGEPRLADDDDRGHLPLEELEVEALPALDLEVVGLALVLLEVGLVVSLESGLLVAGLDGLDRLVEARRD